MRSPSKILLASLRQRTLLPNHPSQCSPSNCGENMSILELKINDRRMEVMSSASSQAFYSKRNFVTHPFLVSSLKQTSGSEGSIHSVRRESNSTILCSRFKKIN